MSEKRKKEAKTYIAITIGPIIRTFGLTATPAALWASSYLFSYIARSIRDKLILAFTPNFNDDDFISPYPLYFNQEDNKLENVLNGHTDDGLGLLHDHMIFLKPQDFTWDKFHNLRDEVIREACRNFTIDYYRDKEAPPSEEVLEKRKEELEKNYAFLKQYVMISAVEFQAENPIMGSSKMLDCAELATTFVLREENNPILSFFTNANDDEGRNEQIKKRGQHQLGLNEEQEINPDKWQLLYKRNRNGTEYNVKNLPAIAQGGVHGSKMKKHAYYAVVRSDGDNMGKLISNLSINKDGNEFHTFSGTCLKYCEKIAEKVKEYHGMTVYAGGDDLLAILPCETLVEDNKRKTVFDFVREANEIFAKMFLTTSEGNSSNKTVKDILDEINEKVKKDDSNEKKLPPPSLTWGITLCHNKYPLYEALEDSASLLFGAKGKGYKDAVNLRLIKHSGQTSAVYIKNDLLKEEKGTFFSLLNDILGRTKKEENTSSGAGTEEEQKKAKENEAKKEAQNNDILLSCLHTFHEARAVFRLADEDNTENLFKNMFDAEAHKDNRFLHESLPKLYADHCLKGDIYALDDCGYKVVLGKTKEEKKKEIPDAPEALHYLLRILKFFVEKAGEKE